MIRAELVGRAGSRIDAGVPAEGAVVYAIHAGRAVAFKCKPPTVVESQARYRELYVLGKGVVDAGATADALTQEIRGHVAANWDPSTHERESRVVDVVCDHLCKELTRQGPRVKPVPAAPVPRPLGAAAARKAAEIDRVTRSTVLWTTVWGSQMWGMADEGSDEDRCVVYQMSDRDVALGASDARIVAIHRRGLRLKEPGVDQHWYEIGRAVRLLLGGSLTMLYGVMSPLVLTSDGEALEELRSLVEQQPNLSVYHALWSDVGDSEHYMLRAHDADSYLKHLRIACRNLQFGLTLFWKGRYEFRPSTATSPDQLAALRSHVDEAYLESRLPARFDPRPFEDYLVRQRHRYRRAEEERKADPR